MGEPCQGERERQYLFRLLPTALVAKAGSRMPLCPFCRFCSHLASRGWPFPALPSQLASLITDILVKAPALLNTIGGAPTFWIFGAAFSPEGIEALANSCPKLQKDEPVELYLDG